MSLRAVSNAEDSPDRNLHALIDYARTAMESEMGRLRTQCQTYLNWYSPEYDDRLGTHDAWVEPIGADDVGLTRANFPIARATVDIWSALEAAKYPVPRAEPERLAPPAPSLDENTAMRNQLVHQAFKTVEGMRANARSAAVRRWMRRDKFALKNFLATKRKDLYGFSWKYVMPERFEKRPKGHVQRNPTTVYPIWSSTDPEDTDAVLCAYRRSAIRAAQEYPQLKAMLRFEEGRIIPPGSHSGEYRELDERWWDATRTMLWFEDYWWIDREIVNGRELKTTVHCVTRAMNTIVKRADYPGWRYIPFVYYENADERSSFGWADIAGVIDINDEINKRLSQEGDIIGHYSAPRFQLLGGVAGRDIEMPGPFELIPLQDTERIEQILTRIDVFPAQQHFNALIELLHRVTGLPPIVWGLINNAQTSGRALTASWKATETRLAPKMMRNEQSLDRELAIWLNYAELYNWNGAKELFTDGAGDRFRDFVWNLPPLEPRDYMEVTQDAITRRDAGLTTTIKAMRDTGDEAAEDTLEEILAEFQNIGLHPDKVNAFLLAKSAELDILARAAQLGQGAPQPQNLATVAQQMGQSNQAMQQAAAPPPAIGPAPPTQEGAVANAAEGPPITASTLMRGGEVSPQLLQTRTIEPRPY